jgi:hypothetical protein
MRYNTPNTPIDNMRDFVTRGGIPVTIVLISISVILFLISFFTSNAVDLLLAQYIAYFPGNEIRAPWTLLTYPVYAGPNFLWLLIGGVIFWLAGGSLERSWGSARFSAFFFALTFISAVSVLVGYRLYAGRVVPLYGFGLPLSGMIVAFCMLNPNLTICIYYFLKLRAIYVAWIITLVTYFTAGMGPILNLFACGGIIAAFLYVRFGRSWADVGSYGGRSRAVSRGPDLRVYPPASKFSTKPRMLDGSERRSPLDLAGRWKDYQERRRLEKLWKNSGFSEPKQQWQDDDRRR